MLALVDIPKHHGAILSSGSTQRAIRRHRGGIHHARVANQVGAKLAVAQVPHLHQLVPTGGHNQRHLC